MVRARVRVTFRVRVRVTFRVRVRVSVSGRVNPNHTRLFLCKVSPCVQRRTPGAEASLYPGLTS